MKKLFTLLAAIALVFTLAACKECDPEVITETITEYVDVPGETVYVDVPGETEYVIINVPGEVEYVDVITEVPMAVENTRFYQPGVYFNNTPIQENGFFIYTVVVVDQYGKIAGILIDETKTTSEFLIDEDENLFVFIPGNGVNVPHTYRAIASDAPFTDYPTAADAITADDLVVGIHEAEIAALTEIEAHETRQILGEAWTGQVELLANKIIADQTTYGIDTAESGSAVTATNIADLTLTNVDVLMGLVQDVLDGDAALADDTVLATTPVMGLYTPGSYYSNTDRLIDDSVNYATSFVVVDQYGAIAGVYTDYTYDAVEDGGHATKWILGEEGYPMTGGWDAQARAFGEAIVKNQGTDGFTDLSPTDATSFKTDQIAGCTIELVAIKAATDNAITAATDIDLASGTYLVSGEVGNGGHALMYVTIDGGTNSIQSVFLDNTSLRDNAVVLRDGVYYEVYLLTIDYLNEADEAMSIETLVYMDDEDYILVNDFTDASDDNEAYEAGEDIVLTEAEIAGLEPIVGNYTKFILEERYGMNAENPWYMQAGILAEELAAGPYSINLTDGTHTDITGVTFGHVEQYRQLLIEAMIMAQATTPAPIADLYDVDNTVTDIVLPDGVYFTSLEPNVEGIQYFAYGIVADGLFETVILDAAISADEYTTTALAVDADLDPLAGTANVLYFSEEAATYVEDFVDNHQVAMIEEMETDFSFELGELTFGDVATPVNVAITEDDDELINTDAFDALLEGLIKEALYAKVDDVAANVWASMPATTTKYYSGQGTLAGILEDAEFEISVSDTDIAFDLDVESTDNGILDLDYDSGDGEWDIIVDEVEATTAVTLTLTIDFDEFVYTKDFTYTIQTIAAAELAALNAIEDDFDAFSQLEGFEYDLTAIDPAPATTEGTFLGWAEEDYDPDAPTYIENTSGLAVGTHTLTALIDYNDDGDTVSRNLVVTVLDIDEAIADVAAAVKPANILNNGEVTEEGTYEFGNTSAIKGIDIEWDEDGGNDGDVADFDGTNELTILRSYETSKIIMTATIDTDLDDDGADDYDDKVVRTFEFRAVAATEAMVEARVEDAIKNVDLGVVYFDTDMGNGQVDTIVEDDLDTIINSAVLGGFEEDAIDAGLGANDISWEVKDDVNGTATVLNALVADADVDVAADVADHTLVVTATIEIDMDNDDTVDVTVTKDFSVILFDSDTDNNA